MEGRPTGPVWWSHHRAQGGSEKWVCEDGEPTGPMRRPTVMRQVGLRRAGAVRAGGSRNGLSAAKRLKPQMGAISPASDKAALCKLSLCQDVIGICFFRPTESVCCGTSESESRPTGRHHMPRRVPQHVQRAPVTGDVHSLRVQVPSLVFAALEAPVPPESRSELEAPWGLGHRVEVSRPPRCPRSSLRGRSKPASTHGEIQAGKADSRPWRRKSRP